MYISVFDIFKVGIGPSSSHTVGPMKAAHHFLVHLGPQLQQVQTVQVALYGSLALTGKGHGTDKAVIMGLAGELPDTINPDTIPDQLTTIRQIGQLKLLGQHPISFQESTDLIYHYQAVLPKHTNGMKFDAYNSHGDLLASEVYYSIGGGFIVTDAEFDTDPGEKRPVPYPFTTAAELLELCHRHGLTISQLMLANEKVFRSEAEIQQQLLAIAEVMRACIEKGCVTEGILPGGLGLKRRAPGLFKKLNMQGKPHRNHPEMMNWLNLYAMAVNEENAAGGKIVTAPTNGAAGIIPAVLNYYREFCEESNPQGICDFLLTAAAIAILYKLKASISGAEVGCQGEVGVACSMAAGALAAVLGGSLEQIENAAEIGMEHNLGLPCDPPKGLVQIPCIERNAMGAVKAINATYLALAGDGHHHISLDTVIKTMRQLGADMKDIYKETSKGGLAVNFPEC
ncbi:MAG: L-serine ammonia-lyase [Gammaproteobacteria bacterium]